MSCCYNPSRSLYFSGPPHTKITKIKMYMLIHVAHITNGFHTIRTYRRIYRINSSTFLFHTILPSPNNFFSSVYVPHTNRHFWKSISLALPLSPSPIHVSLPLSFTLCGCVCLFVIFSVFSSHEKNYCVFCCAVVVCVFFSMPMAFYYSLFGNCS